MLIGHCLPHPPCFIPCKTRQCRRHWADWSSEKQEASKVGANPNVTAGNLLLTIFQGSQPGLSRGHFNAVTNPPHISVFSSICHLSFLTPLVHNYFHGKSHITHRVTLSSTRSIQLSSASLAFTLSRPQLLRSRLQRLRAEEHPR